MDIYKRRTYRMKKGGSPTLEELQNSDYSDLYDNFIYQEFTNKNIEKLLSKYDNLDDFIDKVNVDDNNNILIDGISLEDVKKNLDNEEAEQEGGFYRNAKNGGTNVLKNAFDDFLREKASLSGGADTEVREGYDSFTIVEASAGSAGGRFISKTPYTAAYKAASRLFKDTKSTSLTFVMQKTTKGSNKRYYAYQATVKYLSKPMLVFKNDEEGNKIVMNTHGQVLRVNKNKKVVNSTGSVKKDYNPNEKISSLTSFNYKPYLIKEVTKDITIKAIEVPSELKEKQMEKAKNKMTDEQKEMMKQKKADKKAREAAKKAAEKEKERARKEKERERARRQKEKEKEQARKEKLRNKKMMLKGGNGMCSLNGCM